MSTELPPVNSAVLIIDSTQAMTQTEPQGVMTTVQFVDLTETKVLFELPLRNNEGRTAAREPQGASRRKSGAETARLSREELHAAIHAEYLAKGDSQQEANETFYLDLFGNSSNSLFNKNRGLGTILNDD